MKKRVLKERHLFIREKLVISSILLIAVMVSVQSALSYVSLGKAYDEAVTVARQGFDSVIQAEVQSMISMLTDNYAQYTGGELTEQQALERAKNLIRNIRYDGDNGYFEADLATGVCAAHMNPKFEGLQRLEYTDKKGTFYIKNIIAAGDQDGGGFSEYYFEKPGVDGVVFKRAFTQKFEPYGWYITTGIYEDDVDAKILVYAAEKNRALVQLLVSSGFLALLIAAAMTLLANSVSANLRKVTKRIQLLADGDLHTPVPAIRARDETRLLAGAAEQTIRSLHEMIADITENLDRMANGDLSSQTSRQYAGDFIPIRDSIRQILGSMNHIFAQSRQSAQQISSSAEQVSAAAQNLSQASAEQAGSVENAVANISRISDQASSNAEKAGATKKLFGKAQEELENGKRRMEDVVKAMRDITASMQSVSKITQAIDDIAFQTNILALNASVEAAHAGDAGRGFAVVAEEVRTLAAKSATEASETAELIEASSHAAAEGTQIVGLTADSLLKIVDSMTEISRIVEEINRASAEQSEHLEEVAANMEQISSVVQANSATAEESAALSEELLAQADLLQKENDQFELAAAAQG